MSKQQKLDAIQKSLEGSQFAGFAIVPKGCLKTKLFFICDHDQEVFLHPRIKNGQQWYRTCEGRVGAALFTKEMAEGFLAKTDCETLKEQFIIVAQDDFEGLN